MSVAYIIGTLHVLTFGLGFASIWLRATALQRLKDQSGVKDVLNADNFWGIAALLWILTGLWRAFGGLEKPSEYYLSNTAFLIKMGLFVLVFAIEIKPMVTLIKWRITLAKNQPIDLSAAPSMARTSWIELALLIPIVSMAAAMARGIFY